MSKTITIKGCRANVTVRPERIDGIKVVGNSIYIVTTGGEICVLMCEKQKRRGSNRARGDSSLVDACEAWDETEANNTKAIKEAAAAIRRAMTGSG